MANLTYTNGQKVDIDGREVIRIRATLSDEPKGKSRVVWLRTDIFEEEATLVAELVLRELPTLASLKTPRLGPIWFNGAKATGPGFVRPNDRTGGINSSFEIGNKIQYVSNTPQEVADVIKKAGGKVLPIRDDSTMATTLEEATSWMKDLEVWDSELIDPK